MIITSRRENILKIIAEDISMKYHASCEIITNDLSEVGAAVKLVKEVDERNRTMDILVNCAGFATKGLLSESDFDKQAREMNVNVKALTELTYLCIGRMAEKKKGLVINVASGSGFNPIPYNAVYSATKAYVLSRRMCVRITGKIGKSVWGK